MKKQLSQRLLPSDPYSITFLWFMPRGEDRQLPLKGFFHEEFSLTPWRLFPEMKSLAQTRGTASFSLHLSFNLEKQKQNGNCRLKSQRLKERERVRDRRGDICQETFE